MTAFVSAGRWHGFPDGAYDSDVRGLQSQQDFGTTKLMLLAPP